MRNCGWNGGERNLRNVKLENNLKTNKYRKDERLEEPKSRRN
jgi:hypothetical protein